MDRWAIGSDGEPIALDVLYEWELGEAVHARMRRKESVICHGRLTGRIQRKSSM